jgi:hypothetical protein
MKPNKKGSEEFHTALNLLIGSIFFVIVALIIMFLFVGEEIKATFDAGLGEVDKIATRTIFTETCLAYSEELVFDWYTDERNESKLVRLGTIDLIKFEESRISDCVGYSITGVYNYTITYTKLESGETDTINPFEEDVSDCKDSQVRIDKEKVYPVIIYDAGNFYNGKLEMRIQFCYEEETIS